jgi:molybdopterin synthase catalytic subunit
MDSPIRCLVSEEEINSEQIFNFAKEHGHGAQNFFFGAVRSENLGRKVLSVGYDAAPALAAKSLREIATECLEKWGNDLRIIVVHRTGKLGVGELSVAIGVSSKHRDESYLASRYIIEEIKTRVPIWKKEYYVDGESEWLKGHALCQH